MAGIRRRVAGEEGGKMKRRNNENHYFEQKKTKETKMLNTFETNSVFPCVNIYIFPNYFNIFVSFVAFCSKNKSSKGHS
jgi:hypothetical protein